MSDLRNKMMKAIRDAEHKVFMKKHYPTRPAPPPIRCPCGHDYYEEPLAQYQIDRWKPPTL